MARMIGKKRLSQLTPLILILLLAAAGRIIHIDAESLWVDEGFSYWAIRHEDMFGLLQRDVHPPVYFVLLRAWAEVAGITELALRYFSVLPSVLSVAVVYQVGRELERLRGAKGETPIPLLAALMLALADMENYTAQETRNYTWHVLWALVSMWMFIRWVRLSKRGIYATHRARAQYAVPLLLWIAASLLLVYTHYIGVCLLAVQAVFVLFFLRGRVRLVALGALGVIGVLFVPWLLVVVGGQTANVGTGFNVPSTLASLWAWRVNWFTEQWALMIGLALLGVVGAVSKRASTTASAPAMNGFAYRHIPLSRYAVAFLLVAWLVLPVALTYLLNHRTPILMDYRITQITPAVALLIAFGLGQFRAQPGVLAFLVSVIVVYGVVVDDTPRPRPPWRAIGQAAAQYAVPGDLAMAHVTPSGDWQMVYYFERFMPEGVERRSLRQWQIEEGSTYATGLPALLQAHPHVWFMHWSKDLSGFEALAATGHLQTARLTWDWAGSELALYRFDVLPEDAITRYESNMILRDAAYHPEQQQLDLWWSAELPLNTDYTVSAILLNEAGQLVAQHDAPPYLRPTTSWQPGEVVYDPHLLQVVPGQTLTPGRYSVAVKVYQWTPDGIIVQPTANGDEFEVIATIEL
ncbi:MAG: hypothetical protein OHK0046_44820 [Anaerolineae bacterium]